jgi:hypothetical protein
MAPNDVPDDVADARPQSAAAPTKKIVLQTYPNQAGVNPVPMDWANPDPEKRGPVVVSHSSSTVKRRNGGITPAKRCNC